MTGTISELPAHERPISEQFRVVAKVWVELDAAANLLEETKSAVLSQMMAKQGDVPVSRAELNVKASQEWSDHVAKICDARREANLKKVHLEFLRMKHAEWQSMNANHRHEARLSR